MQLSWIHPLWGLSQEYNQAIKMLAVAAAIARLSCGRNNLQVHTRVTVGRMQFFSGYWPETTLSSMTTLSHAGHYSHHSTATQSEEARRARENARQMEVSLL